MTAPPTESSGTPPTTTPPATPPPVTPPGPQPVTAGLSLTTYHNDVARSGWNFNESILTTANVNQAQFGKLFSYDVDGEAYAQPLYLSNVSIAGQGTRNVVYVATQHDSVYAFDADGKSTAPLWQRSFINPDAGITTVPSTDLAPDYTDIFPEIGITSTPVIDAAAGTIYVVAKTKENGKYFQRLHALDVSTGAEKEGSPVTIDASLPGLGDGAVNGNIVFDPLINLQRSALLLVKGVVYVAFASHGDFDPFHGWLLGYDAGTLKQVVAYCPSLDGAGGGIWASGNGLAADKAGDIFAVIANGDYNAQNGGRDYGDSMLRLRPANGTLQVLDHFTPWNFIGLNADDLDLGSGGPILLDETSGPPHLMIGGSKEGRLYVVNRDNMGRLNTERNDNQIVQSLLLDGPLFGSPAVFQNTLYISPVRGALKAYEVKSGQLTATATAPQVFGYPGSTPAVSSNGNSNGIVWTLQRTPGGGPAVLHAYDATDVSRELYNSALAGDRDQAATAVKFTVPSVINGKVYVGGNGRVTVYGLLTP